MEDNIDEGIEIHGKFYDKDHDDVVQDVVKELSDMDDSDEEMENVFGF